MCCCLDLNSRVGTVWDSTVTRVVSILLLGPCEVLFWLTVELVIGIKQSNRLDTEMSEKYCIYLIFYMDELLTSPKGVRVACKLRILLWTLHKPNPYIGQVWDKFEYNLSLVNFFLLDNYNKLFLIFSQKIVLF